MKFRIFITIIGLSVFFDITDGSLAWVQASVPTQCKETVTLSGKREFFVNKLDLKTYEAAARDLSWCAGDKSCITMVKVMKAWLCAAKECDRKDKKEQPIACFMSFPHSQSGADLGKINTWICPYIKSPSTETRRALVSHMRTKEDKLVENEAYLLALNGSAVSCENYIKDYVGAYGHQWKIKWFGVMSGCRILARQSTLELEEEDYYTWFGVMLGSGHCSGILNSEMRRACNSLGTGSTMLSPVEALLDEK